MWMWHLGTWFSGRHSIRLVVGLKDLCLSQPKQFHSSSPATAPFKPRASSDAAGAVGDAAAPICMDLHACRSEPIASLWEQPPREKRDISGVASLCSTLSPGVSTSLSRCPVIYYI